jgi:signal transduction histidine kinase
VLAGGARGKLNWRDLSAPPTSSRLILAAGLLLVIACLGWLMFGVAGNRAGMQGFPDAAGSHVEILQDPLQRLGIGEVKERPDSAWQSWDGKSYIRAAHGDAVWMRVTLRNPGPAPLDAVLSDTEYFPDHVDAWTESRQMHSGEALSAEEKPLWSRTAAFPLTVPAGGEEVVYLRAKDHYFVYLRPRWWPRAADFSAAQLRDTLAECLCYGGLIALLLYNAVLWLRLRFPDLGYYVLYAGAMVTFNFVSNGGVSMLVNAAGSPWKEMIVAGSLALSGFFLVQFARAFLGTKDCLPRIDRLLVLLRILLLFAVLGVAAMPWMTSLLWLDLVVIGVAMTNVAMLTVAVLARRKGVAHARFFIIAFGVLFTGATPATLTWLNQDILAGAAMGLLAGSALEMLLLSFAVADRFAQAQKQLVEETEQRRMIEEAYAEELEIEVHERTRELQTANADKDRMLAVIGHDLRSPLTGLMLSADLERGPFPREVSRTGRELLLMIEDLVLWARLRAGTGAEAEHRLGSLVAPAVALHHSLAEHGGVALSVELPEETRVCTDLVLAQTLVRNLLANALKFADRRVVMRAEPAGDAGLHFTVWNDGPALSAEVAGKLAAGEDAPMTATGGMGLRLCREICRALDMQLEARAGVDGGTEFGFTFILAGEAAEVVK